MTPPTKTTAPRTPRAFTGWAWKSHVAAYRRGKGNLVLIDRQELPEASGRRIRVRVTPLPAKAQKAKGRK